MREFCDGAVVIVDLAQAVPFDGHPRSWHVNPETRLDFLLDQYEEWREVRAEGSFDDFVCERLGGQSEATVARLRIAVRKLAAFDECVRPTDRAVPQGLRCGEEPVPGYRLQAKLGQGGFGQVWRAVGPGGVECAMKFVEVGGPTAATELRALDAVRNRRHPNLTAIFGVWQRDSWLVVAMELADRSLADELHAAVEDGSTGIPPRRLARYLREAAAGLDYLAADPRGGVQHRDVKPQNLLSIGGSVKVADFGLARVLDRSEISHTGNMTFEYAAPEFFENRTTLQSDQYSLAVTYCVLRGNRLPFLGTRAALLRGHTSLPPDLGMIPPSERPAVSRALSKAPQERWESCTAFAEAIAAADSAPAPDPLLSNRVTVRAHETLPLDRGCNIAFDFGRDETVESRPPRPLRLVALFAVVLATALAAAFSVWWALRSPTPGTIRFPGLPVDASVSVDGQPTARNPGSEIRIAVEPGPHSVTVRRPGYSTYERQVEVSPGESLSLQIELSPIPTPVASAGATLAARATSPAQTAPPSRPVFPLTEPTVPSPSDPAAATARAMLRLGKTLEKTRWSWPDNSLPKPWFELNENRTVTAGWHGQRGTWEVASPTTIRAVVMSSPRTLQTFLVDLEAGTLKNVRTGEVHRRIR